MLLFIANCPKVEVEDTPIPDQWRSVQIFSGYSLIEKYYGSQLGVYAALKSRGSGDGVPGKIFRHHAI